MIRRILIIPVILFLFSTGRSADNREIWEQAAESYDNGDYNAAIESYSKLMERGFISPELYYNLGNAYFKSGDLGTSIWSYRRALKLEPGMKQAKANLEYARQFNIDKIDVKEGGFVLDIWSFLTSLTTSNGYLLLLSASWWVIATMVVLLILKPGQLNWLYYLLIVVILVAIFSGSASVTRVRIDKMARWGVLAAPSADIREGPGSEFDRIEVGHEGLEFKILGEREESYLIELKNGLKGWVAAKAVLEV